MNHMNEGHPREIDLLAKYPRSNRNIAARTAWLSASPENRAIAKRFGREYFDGTRDQGYGGYRYDGRWIPVVQDFIAHYGLAPSSSFLDVGCGKGFFLHDLVALLPGIKVAGVDISEYAIENSMEDVKPFLKVSNATSLPYPDKSFDAVVAINTLHNLKREDCKRALQEIVRVSRGPAYVQVDSFRNAEEKQNLERWQLTAELIYSPEEWQELFAEAGYIGDYYWTIID